jgi:hypothetical protein
MKRFAAAVLLAALCGCSAPAGPGPETVTIYQPNEAHFVRTIRFDARTGRISIESVGLRESYTVPRDRFPALPIAALRWVEQNGGFNQPIQTTQASEIVGVRVDFGNGPPIDTRFASAWDVDEPAALKSVQSWYESAVYCANTAGNRWHAALAAAIRSGRVRQIRFMPGDYTLVIDRNGGVHLALRRGRRMLYAYGRVDRRAIASIYRAALLLSPKAPVYDANDPPTHVEIIAAGQRFMAVGSNDAGFELFAARADQLARDVRWNHRLAF